MWSFQAILLPRFISPSGKHSHEPLTQEMAVNINLGGRILGICAIGGLVYQSSLVEV